MISRTYTLDRLLFFAEHGLDRLPMLHAMKALGIDDDAIFALRSSDSTRDGNVVRLYRDYGGAYGLQLETYIDSVVASHPAASGPEACRYSLGQLAWVHAVGLLRDDMSRDMQAIGIPKDVATQLAAPAAEHRTVLGIWKDHGQRHGEVLERYMDAALVSYQPGWPPHGASADFDAGEDNDGTESPAQ